MTAREGEEIGRGGLFSGSGFRRFVALQQILLLLLTTSCQPEGALDPKPGVLAYRRPIQVEVPGGWVDVAGGNLLLERVDLTIDSLFGSLAVGAVYNSASRDWIWSFEMSYDGSVFVDATGARHRIEELPDGAPIPGTHWDRVDDRRIRTRGGLLYTFDPLFHHLVSLSWGETSRPALVFFAELIAGRFRNSVVAQCRDDGECRLVYVVEYDDSGCVVGLEDRAGRRALFENDEACRPLVARDALDLALGLPGTRYSYLNGSVTESINSEGERIQYGLLWGRLVSLFTPASSGPFLQLEYGFNSLRGLHYSLLQDARGGRSLYRYDAEGRLHEFESPTGESEFLTWSGLRPLSQTDAADAVTRWEYENDEPVRIELPTGNVILREYAEGAEDRSRPLEKPIRRVADALGLVEERIYDVRGRMIESKNGMGEIRRFTYSAEGSLGSVTEPDGGRQLFSDYGEHGHAETVVRGGLAFGRSFDAVGNLLTGEDLSQPLSPGRPGIRRRHFDEDRNLVEVELEGETHSDPIVAESASLVASYRSDGGLLAILRPFGGDTHFEYDAAGRPTSRRDRVDGLWQTRSYEYGPAGDLVATELPNGMRAEVSHDPAGRPLFLRWLRDGVEEKSLGFEWESGRLLSLSDSRRAGPEIRSHDSAGRLISTLFPEGEVLEQSYDLRSREISHCFRLAPGLECLTRIDFEYDLANRRTQLLQDAEMLLAWGFEDGRLVGIFYGNGLRRGFEYDRDSGLLLSSRLLGPDLLPIESTSMEWSVCLPTAYCVTASAAIEATSAGSVPSLLIDEGYRLGPRPVLNAAEGVAGSRIESWARYPLNLFQTVGEERYAFDVLGNWIAVLAGPLSSSNFSFNAERNRLVTSNTGVERSYEWDEAGFLLARDDLSIHWDASGKPTRIGSEIELEWDSLGRMISATSGGTMMRSLFGGRMSGDANRQPIALDLGEVELGLASGERIYRHEDFRGNVQMVTDEEGDLVKHYSYSPFAVSAVHGDAPDTRSFAQGEKLGDFLLLGNRLYDPETGRFISPDPIDHPLNAYAYTLGNPVLFWDPGGEHAVPSPAAAVVRGAREVSTKTESVGLVVLGVGLNVKNAPLVVAGVSFLLVSILSGVVASVLEFHLQQGKVTIEDLPGDSSPTGPSSSVPAPELPGSGVPSCAPRSLAEAARGSSLAVLLLPLQLLLAAGVLGWFRRRSRSGPRIGKSSASAPNDPGLNDVRDRPEEVAGR